MARLHRTVIVLAIASLCALPTVAVSAAEVTGSARVLDGDTIEIGSTKVRLYGIDAPEGAVDADTGRIVASELTTHDADDGAQVGPLLDQVAAPLASFTGDGAYDQDGVYASVAERHPEARVIVPPRSTAVPSATAETAPTQRDRHLQLIAEKGRMGWQKASGYNARARAEATIGRFKRVIGDGLRSRTDERRATEMDVAVQVMNRMLELGRPKYVRTA